MKTTLTVTMLIAASMALAFTPSTNAEPCQDDDDGDMNDPRNPDSGTVGWGDDCEAAFATGPGVVEEQGVLLVGGAVCFVNNTFPLACDPVPGNTAAAGAAFFDVDAWNGRGPIAHVNVWAEWQTGVWGDTEAGENGGFLISVCNDRDDDDVCTNQDTFDDDFDWEDPMGPPGTGPHTPDGMPEDGCCDTTGLEHDHGLNAGFADPDEEFDDQGFQAYSTGGGDCEDPKKKDDKTCNDMDVSHNNLCLVHDTEVNFNEDGVPGFYDHGWDDIVVFIGNYHSSDLIWDSTKEGVSSGTYLVTMELVTEDLNGEMGDDGFPTADHTSDIPPDGRSPDGKNAGCVV